MPEKFVYEHGRQASYLFIEAIAGLKLDHPVFKGYEKEGSFEVELKVNGYEVPFSRAIEMLDENFERCVESRAKELLQEKAAELTAKLEQIGQIIDELFPVGDADY